MKLRLCARLPGTSFNHTREIAPGTSFNHIREIASGHFLSVVARALLESRGMDVIEVERPVPGPVSGRVTTSAVDRDERACTGRILIVDDEPANVQLLEKLLRRDGLTDCVSTTDSQKAATLFEQWQPDLVLLDLHMPGLDGFAVMEQLQELIGPEEYLPILVLTADATSSAKRRALGAGATDFLTKPFDALEVLLRIRNLLDARKSHLTIQAQNATLEARVRERTAELERALEQVESMQQQAIQQERLAALGTMAGGIAHDFNNALSVITGFGEILLRESAGGLTREAAQKPLRTIMTAADDAAKIVHRLRQFYHPTDEQEQLLPVNLEALVTQAITLTTPKWQTASRSAGRPISLQAELGKVPNIGGDAAELREALTNLIFNAVDAMPKGGTITIRTWSVAEDVFLQISDTGSGMTEEVRRRCFEPFFTTKGERGTGLGLAMVFGIIERHGGTSELESTPGVGTTFTFRFPACAGEPAPVPSAAGAVERLLHILVVDDQPILCELLADSLAADCHTVETAENGKEALRKFCAGDFDLVITDQAMPELTGLQLTAEVKKVSPVTPVIILTGYGEPGERTGPGGVDCVLSKPVSHHDLRRAIASVIR